MADSFSIVLELLRSDFKDTACLLSDADGVDGVLGCIGSHKLNNHAYVLGKRTLPTVYASRLEALYQKSCYTITAMCRSVSQISQHAKEQGLNCVVMKGVALNDCIYGDTITRSFGDIDILVPPKDALAFHRMLVGLGYSQKMGPSSSAMGESRYKRAFLAANMKRLTDPSSISPFPVKGHQDKPEYKPYRCREEAAIEMHDGVYYLSVLGIQDFFQEAVEVNNSLGHYRAPNPEHTLVLLIASVFENSESFFSNTYDFGAVLRDYVDLRSFFERYRDTLDWQKVANLIERFEIGTITRTVLGNLSQVYERDMTFGCLPGYEPLGSEWGLGIIERMRDSALAREKTLTVMRQRWRLAGSTVGLSIPNARTDPKVTDFRKYPSCDGVRFNIEHTSDSIILSWALAQEGAGDDGSYLYQFKFFPLASHIPYTAYCVDLNWDKGAFQAKGHRTNRHNLGAIRKEIGTSLALSCHAHNE